jgi:hypothetical protein
MGGGKKCLFVIIEHGAGHPRGGELEKERDELARRSPEKYGSDHPSGPTLHFNFVGVFDRVAALGALEPAGLPNLWFRQFRQFSQS